MVAPGEYFGGAERQILSLLTQLQMLGITGQLILLFDRELATQAREAGIPTMIVGQGARFDVEALRALRNVLPRYNVVHAHGYKATVMVGLSRRASGFALVKTEHGRVESGGGKLRERIVSGAYRWLENTLTRRADGAIVYVTRDLQRFYKREHAGFTQCVISNGIDAQQFSGLSRPEELNPSRFNVVVLGRLEHVKGVEYAIEAMASDAMPADVTLNIVGDGPLRQSLATAAANLERADAVKFHGFRLDGIRFAAHADMLLMPSLHEGLPYTLLEALAAGTPVAASAVGGLAEILKSEETALLFEPANAQSVSAAIARLRGDGPLRERLVENARTLLLPRYSSRAMAEAYLALYREQLAVQVRAV